MITFHAVALQHHRRHDGTYPIKIRITFRGRSRYLPTTITCKSSELTRSMKIKSPDAIARVNAICDRLRAEAADLNPFDLEGRDVDYVVARLTEAMRREDFRLDFFEWADRFLRTKTDGNRLKYDTALRAFARYLGRRELNINEITHAMLVGFADYCDTGNKLGYDRRTGGIRDTGIPRTRKISPQYLSRLSHVFDAAKDRYNDEDGGAVLIPRSPFRKLDMTPPAPTTAQQPLPTDVIQAIIDAPADDPQRPALDAFIVGFALMGANFADLWEATPPKGRKWAYFRRKTRNRRADRARIEVAIPAEIRTFLGRLGDGTSRAWWLPVLHSFGTSFQKAGMAVNLGLRKWCERRGIPPFTFYACRHTWATLARRDGVEKATVDEGLGHVGDFRITDIYAERDWDRIADANRRVLSLFRWQ